MNYRKVKIFDGKKIIIRPSLESDIKNANEFQDFINNLIAEEAEINRMEKQTLKEETDWLVARKKRIKEKKEFHLIAEDNNVIVGGAFIDSKHGRMEHVSNLGIMIRKGYRGLGLGSFMINEIIKLSQKELKFKPKIIRLSVTATNKNAFEFYIKNWFKKAAVVPKQFKVKGKLVDEYIMLKYL